MHVMNDSIITTSHPLVRMKYGMLITSAMACMTVPTSTLTCNIIKYEITIIHDPMILLIVSTFKLIANSIVIWVLTPHSEHMLMLTN